MIVLILTTIVGAVGLVVGGIMFYGAYQEARHGTSNYAAKKIEERR